MKRFFSYKQYVNINYKTQAMIRYLFDEVSRKNITEVTQKAPSLSLLSIDCDIYQ